MIIIERTHLLKNLVLFIFWCNLYLYGFLLFVSSKPRKFPICSILILCYNYTLYPWFCSEIFILLLSTGENGSVAISKMLKFISGLEQVPPLGLPGTITIKFKYFCNPNCHCRPTASTCDPSITFPLHYDTYDAFCQSMSSALVEGLALSKT